MSEMKEEMDSFDESKNNNKTRKTKTTAPICECSIQSRPIHSRPIHSRPPIRQDDDGFYRPSCVQEVKDLVIWAKQPFHFGMRPGPLSIRVRGAGHSFPRKAIYTNSIPGLNPREINIRLCKMRRITWHDEKEGIVEAEAGINLRWDPHNPYSTEENGLLQQLSAKDWTFMDLGGIVAQTVGGFLSTGSAGGAVDLDTPPKRALETNIMGFTFVDGNGQIKKVMDKDTGPHKDLYHAIGVSMGLLGIITSVHFKCTKLFSVHGEEKWTSEEDCEIDLFGPGLQKFITEVQYTRILWYPAIDKVGVWKATKDREEVVEEDPEKVPAMGTPYENPQDGTDEEECMAGIFATIIGNLQDLSHLPRNIEPVLMRANELLGNKNSRRKDRDEDRDAVGAEVRCDLDIKMEHIDNEEEKKGDIDKALESIMTTLLREGAGALAAIPGIKGLGKLLYETRGCWVPAVTRDFIGHKKLPHHVKFRDYVWKILPMDQDIDYELQPTWFTELWFPLDKTEQVMKTMRNYMGGEVGQRDFDRTGWMGFEFYGATTSPFWLSPSFAGPMFRVDIFWFGYSGGEASEFFNQYFELLNDFDFKVHWGKFKPVDTSKEQKKLDWGKFKPVDTSKEQKKFESDDTDTVHDQAYWNERFETLYNRDKPAGATADDPGTWTSFMNERAKCDPDNIFLTDYWRQHLGLQDAEPKHTDAPMVEPVAWIYSEEWQTATRWITFMCMIILGGIFLGLAAAHLPAIMGDPWSSCDAYNETTKEGFKQRSGCIFAYHLIQVPIFLLLVFFTCYGFYISCKTVPYGTSLSAMRRHIYNFHSIFTMTLSFGMIFALIEVNFVFDSFRRAAPTWETGLLIFLSSTLEISITLGIVVLFKLNDAMLLIQRSSDSNEYTNPNMI